MCDPCILRQDGCLELFVDHRHTTFFDAPAGPSQRNATLLVPHSPRLGSGPRHGDSFSKVAPIPRRMYG